MLLLKIMKVILKLIYINLNKYELILQDNGVGFPDKPTSKVAIGLELVSMMVLQINGHLNRKNQQGAIYNISF